MAAGRADVLLFVVILYFTFCFKYGLFTHGKHGIDNCRNLIHVAVSKKLFGCAFQKGKPLKIYRNVFICSLLLLCGDIEPCPGPCFGDINSFCNVKGLKILHQNIRGLFNNIANIEILLSKRIDILTLSETHTTSLLSDNHFNIQGFNFVSKPRENGNGGGVAVYISDRLQFKRRHDLEKPRIECIWIELVLKGKNLLLCSMYRPPDSSTYTNPNFASALTDMLNVVNDQLMETILMGDLNINYLKRDDHHGLKHIFNVQSLKQIVKKPTRVSNESSTMIDLIFTNNESTIAHVDVLPLCLSDHDCVGCVRKINHQKFPPRQITCRNYSRYNPNDFNNDLRSHDWSVMYHMSSVENAWKYFKEVFRNVMDNHAPIIQKRVKGKPCRWLSTEIKELMNRRDKALRKARKTNSETDSAEYKSLKNRCNNKIRVAKNRYQKDLLIENKNNPAKFWQTIKTIFPTAKSSINTQSSVDKDSLHAKVNSFCRYFSSCAVKLKDLAFPLQHLRWKKPKEYHQRTENVFTFGYVSKLFVEKQLSTLKRNKATGADGIPPKLLKDAASGISAPLSFIINLSLRTSSIPTDWKLAKVVPLHKKGDSSLQSNYRPISVLSVCSKILERAVHHQLIDFLEKEQLFSNNQYGYRKHRSTEHATIFLTDNIRKFIDKGRLVGALFVDLSKAFDTLSHAILLGKLRSYGIKGIALDWFKNYLFNRKQFCEIDGVRSELNSIVCGVPQGSILGPLLFLLYFNDFEDHVPNSQVVQFADDTVLYCSGKSIAVLEHKLNEDLSSVQEYFAENQLIMNVSKGKTESIVFGTHRKLNMTAKSINIYYNGHKISSATHYKYLGIQLDQTLTLADHFNAVYKKASNKLYLLNRLRSKLTREAALQIYRGIIMPALLYNSSMLLKMNNTQLGKLNSLDNRASKITLCTVPKLRNEIEKHCCLLVKKCLVGKTCDTFQNYFIMNNHGKNTRNNGYTVIQPMIKLECTKAGFFFFGPKLYNSLPLDIRKCDSFGLFRTLCKKHFL